MSPAPDTRQRRWILAALMATMMLAAMDITIVATAIPQIVSDLGGFTRFTWLFSSYLLAQTVTIPIYGKLSDLHGRKPVLIGGTLIFLIGSVASAISWSMIALIVFRGLQGIGAGAIMATVNTIAGDLYSVRERARIQGWLSSVWAVSAILGPTLGGAFAQYLSWRWIFLINLPIGAVAITLIGLFLREQVPQHQHRIDFAGAAAVLLAVGTLIFGLLQAGQAWPWLSWPSLAVFAGAGILITLAVRIERQAVEPIIPAWLWSRRVLANTNLAMVGMGLIMMAPITYLPIFAQSVLGLGAIAAGLLLAAMSIGWPVASSLSGHLYLRVGFRNTGLCGAVLVVGATIGFLTLPYPGPVWALVLDQVILGAGFGLLATPLLVGVQSAVAWEHRGVVTSTNMFSRYLGQSLGAAMFGAIFNATVGARLARAPLDQPLPIKINALTDPLQGREIVGEAEQTLQHALYAAIHHIYIGAAIVALVVLFLVVLTPRRFPTARAPQSAAATAPQAATKSTRPTR
ncbi:MAG: MFS transporter [Nitrococcus sp.]|nr:MFS transporter [Nitrococcus sp.]